jgi:hypothetical protein
MPRRGPEGMIFAFGDAAGPRRDPLLARIAAASNICLGSIYLRDFVLWLAGTSRVKLAENKG